MTISVAYNQLLSQLCKIYESREAANIADMVMEHVTGQRRIDRITFKDIAVNAEQQSALIKFAEELLQHKPVQYVLGFAWFMNLKLRVNGNVLIPRPETEELVNWIVQDIAASTVQELALIDVGTGSGCISIAAKNNLPTLEVTGIDVSENALQVAKFNSVEQNVLIDFLHLNFLNEVEWKQLGRYDIIVSNPPYILQSEQHDIKANVLNYEPPEALFVPDNNPLLFYEAIAKFSRGHLKNEGRVYLEINEAMGEKIVELFKQHGFRNVVLKKDMQGKNRMVKAAL